MGGHTETAEPVAAVFMMSATIRPYRPKTSAKMRIRIYRNVSIACLTLILGTYHANKQTRLLCGTAHTSVTNNADGEASSETSKADGQASAELHETLVQSDLGANYIRKSCQPLCPHKKRSVNRTVSRDKHRNDETVDLYSISEYSLTVGQEHGTYSDDTSHDDWNNVLHHQVWAENCHRRDTNARLGGTVTGQRS